MKNKSLKTVSIIIALLAITLLTSCGKDDRYYQPKNITYYITTDHMTLSPGAPFTINDVANDFKYYFDLGARSDYYDLITLSDIIKETYSQQAKKGWTSYYHGYVIIMSNMKTPKLDDKPIYKLDFDTRVLTQLYFQ